MVEVVVMVDVTTCPPVVTLVVVVITVVEGRLAKKLEKLIGKSEDVVVDVCPVLRPVAISIRFLWAIVPPQGEECG